MSGITLSIFETEDRRKLVDLCFGVRARGGVVAFDPNYRARGWASPQAAHAAIAEIAPAVTIALPTLADDVMLYGQASVDDCCERWRNWGVAEIAIKLGGEGVAIAAGGALVVMPAKNNPSPRDTTGAGDSFNAAYLSTRLRGGSQAEAANAGNLLAAAVVEHSGAIIEPAAMPADLSSPTAEFHNAQV